MIRRDYSSEFKKDNQDHQNQSRDFTRILRAAKPLWQEVLPKPEKDIVRGLVFAANRGITADLSFNTHRKRVILMIRLRTNNGLTPSQEQSVRKVQSESQGLCSIVLDEDSRILKIRSQSVLPAAVFAEVVVPHVFEDAVQLLDDDKLRGIVDQSVSY